MSDPLVAAIRARRAEGGPNIKMGRTPELVEEAKKIKAGTSDKERYRVLADRILGDVRPYPAAPPPPTPEQIQGALRASQKDRVNAHLHLPEGHPVESRLDIPAYVNKGVWVPTLHYVDPVEKKRVTSHAPHTHLTDAVFHSPESKALNIAAGGDKSPFAVVRGKLKRTSPEDAHAMASRIMADPRAHPEWRQVGMNPERHSYFYDRETRQPVKTADEALQVGHVVLAKNPTYDDPAKYKFAKGGEVDRQLSPLGLYSHAAEQAEAVPQEQGTPEQYKGMLTKRGVSPEEFKWSGYDQAFAGKKRVAKGELAKHFRDNLPKLQETVLGKQKSKVDRSLVEANAIERAYNSGDIEERRHWADASEDVRDWHRQAAHQELAEREHFEPTEGATRHEQWTLPGGQNYREHLLHLPEGQQTSRRMTEIEGRLQSGAGIADEERGRLQREYRDLADKARAGSDYHSSHWDQPNVLLHYRLSDREEKHWLQPEGTPMRSWDPRKTKKILHLEELQSDWAQQGRKGGINRPLELPEGFKFRDDDLRSSWNEPVIVDPRGVAVASGPTREAALRQLHGNQGTASVPDAPYIGSTQRWVNLGLQRLLHHAAQGGYDKVVVTPGQEQADRYNLAKHIKELEFYKPDAGVDRGSLRAIDHNGNEVINKHMAVEELEQHIGKEAAAKLMATKGKRSSGTITHSLANQDLKVGGEGMKAFYDTIVPMQLEKLAKQHDPQAKVQLHATPITKPEQYSLRPWTLPNPGETDETVPHSVYLGDRHISQFNSQAEAQAFIKEHKAKGEKAAVRGHSLDITPAMRKSILSKGFKAYHEGGFVERAPRADGGGLPPDQPPEAPPETPPAASAGIGHNQGPPLTDPAGVPERHPLGGLSFPPEEGADRLRLQAKRIASGKATGAPGNKRTVIKAPKAKKGERQLPDFVTGDINFEDWRKRHEQILSKDEIHEAAKWYSKINGMFHRYYPGNEPLAHKHRNAWLVAQQNISPPGAMHNVLMQQEQMNRGVPRELWTAGGMPNPTEAARAVLSGQPIEGGVGQKISDFVDSAEEKAVRSWMNNQHAGGEPFVVDVHTARDTGMVDEELINHLKRLGYKVPELKKDLGTSPGQPQYENRAAFGRELTKHLNGIKWMGRDDWKPHEVQAIGWMGMTKLTRNKEEGAEEGLERNLRRVSFEMAPGEHSPWHQKYGAAFDTLPETAKYGLTEHMTAAAMRHAEQMAGIQMQDLVHGTGAWQQYQNPATVAQMLATEKGASIASNVLGYLLNQTEVWHNRVKPPTANPGGFGLDLIEHGGVGHLADPKMLQHLWETVMAADKTGLIQGYQPITTAAGERGIRALIDKGGKKTLQMLEESLKENGALAQAVAGLPYDVRAKLHEAEITKARNDWSKDKDGQAYLRGLEQALGRDPRADLDRARTSLEEELEDYLDQAHAKAGTAWRQEGQVRLAKPRKKASGGALIDDSYKQARVRRALGGWSAAP